MLSRFDGAFFVAVLFDYSSCSIRSFGYWGMLRKEYLKNHKSGMYSYLLLTGKLDSYLADLNEQSQKQYELAEAQMRSAEGVTEKLKAQNPIECCDSVIISGIVCGKLC